MQDVEQEFWVEGNETFTIRIFPRRGYDIKSILWNGVEEEDPDFWNGSLNFISGSNIDENINIVIKFHLIRVRSVVNSNLGNSQVYFNENFTISAPPGAPPNN